MAFSEEEYGIDLGYKDSILATAGKNFNLQSGLSNVAQAIINRLRTRRGELFSHPDYGSDLYIIQGQGITPTTIKLARLYTVEAIVADPRISEVLDVTIKTNTNENTMIIFARAIAIDKYNEVNIVYPYVLDGES